MDYVICGGGTAGLAVANRLSEDGDVTVAVIEAGDHPSDTTMSDVPAAVYYQSALGGPADWKYTTTKQAGLNDQSKPFPQGRTMGGSSTISDLYLVRASQRQHNSWAILNNASDVWGWSNYFTYAKKSEHFVAPVNNIRDHIAYNLASHGSKGPVFHSYSAEEPDVVSGYLRAWQDRGFSLNHDPYGGDISGLFLATSNINPADWTRWSARRAYLDGIAGQRKNLYILPNAQCTKIIFGDGPNGGGLKVGQSVQYGSSASADTVHEVRVKQEVILASGVIGSPQLLQVSGIGDPTLLQKVGVPVVVELEGVGWHLTDHISSRIAFSPKTSTVLPAAQVTGDARADSFVNAAVCYSNLTQLFGGETDEASRWLKRVKSQVDDIVDTLRQAGAPPSVLTGYKVTLKEQLSLLDKFTPSMEFSLDTTSGQIQIQTALKSPVSRGSALINSANPFVQPTIDPGYLRSKFDVEVLTAALKISRKVGQQAAFASFHDGEKSDTASFSSDASWETWLRGTSATSQYNPSGSCSMLPKEWGGVVDNTLIVHGTSNVRVVDASVVPFPMSCHLMTVVYGVAEIAADLIKARRKGVEYKGTPQPGDPDSPDRYHYFNGLNKSTLTGDDDNGDSSQGSGSNAGKEIGAIYASGLATGLALFAIVVTLVS